MDTLVAFPRSATIDNPSTHTAPAEKPDGRRERGRRRQSELLDATRDLLIENGYRGTTLEAIIARAGGSRVTIYRAFGGKSGLVSAIIAQSSDDLAPSVDSPMAIKLPPQEALMRFGLQLSATWRSEAGQAINRAVVSEGLEAPDLLGAWYRSGFEPSITALSHYFDAQAAAGLLAPRDSRLASRQFIMLLMGEMAYPMIAGLTETEPPNVHVQRCIDLILASCEVAGEPPRVARACRTGEPTDRARRAGR